MSKWLDKLGTYLIICKFFPWNGFNFTYAKYCFYKQFFWRCFKSKCVYLELTNLSCWHWTFTDKDKSWRNQKNIFQGPRRQRASVTGHSSFLLSSNDQSVFLTSNKWYWFLLGHFSRHPSRLIWDSSHALPKGQSRVVRVF